VLGWVGMGDRQPTGGEAEFIFSVMFVASSGHLPACLRGSVHARSKDSFINPAVISLRARSSFVSAVTMTLSAKRHVFQMSLTFLLQGSPP
jgi:hypothetical protein